jgi:hypothetical protein
MGSNIDKANKLTNGAILIISTVLKHILSSATEAEIGAVRSSMQKKEQYFTQHWKNWNILSPQHHWKQKTQQQHATVMGKLNKHLHKLWKRNFIG